MNDCAFLILPTDFAIDDEGWEQLSRGDRMESLAAQSAQLDELGARIRERLPEAELERHTLGGWTVRFRGAMDQETLAARLAGLPIAVAPDERFYAQ